MPDPYVICFLVSLTLNPIPKHPLSPGQAGAEGAREVGGRGPTTQDQDRGFLGVSQVSGYT